MVLHSVDEEAVVFPVVGVISVGQRHQLDGLTLLQDAAGGPEAIQVSVNHFCGNIADLLIGETLDRIHQNTLIDEERISCHLLKLLIRKFRLAVWNEDISVVLPGHSELDEMQQVLAAVTNRTHLEALTVTGDTPLAASPVTKGTTDVPRGPFVISMLLSEPFAMAA